MPRALARAFTASSNGFGTRMLSCSSFFSNSNLAGLNCEKSRWERSCSRNASASSSVLSLGTFFLFIARYLLGMHIPSTDRTDHLSPLLRSEGKGHKYRATFGGPADGNQSVLTCGMPQIRSHTGGMPEHFFNFRKGHAMLLAFRPVARVPLEALHPEVRHNSILHKCIYI